MNGAQGNNNNGNGKMTRREIDDMKEIIKRQEERIHNLETKALQLINLYFAFQGVLVNMIHQFHQAELEEKRHRLRVDNQGQAADHEGEGQLQVGENDNGNRPRGD